MAIRINCPACKTANTVADDKRGKCVKCKSCDKPISVPDGPAKKKGDSDEAIQETSKIKAKAANGRKRNDEDDDDAPASKNIKKPKKGSSTLLIVGGITAAVLLFCVVGVGGGGIYVLMRTKAAAQDMGDGMAKAMKDAEERQFAQAKAMKDEEDRQRALNQVPKVDPPKANPNPPVDPNPKIDLNPPVDPKPKINPNPPVDPKPPVDPNPPVDPKPKVDPPKIDPNPPVDPKPKVDPNPKINLIPKGEPAPSVADSTIREPYAQNNQTRLPVQFALADPQKRISEVQVEMWIGQPGQPRPTAMQQPEPQPGDGPRQAFKLVVQNGAASGDLLVPALPAGQVVWVQPVLVSALGRHWGPATPVTIGTALVQRTPVILAVNLTTPKDRTIKLNTVWSDTNVIANATSREKIDLDALETLSPHPLGATVRVIYGSTANWNIESDRPPVGDPQAIAGFKHLSPSFVIDRNNVIKERIDRKTLAAPDGKTPILPGKKFGKKQEQANEAYWHLHTALEVASIPMPNRPVQPLELWNATVPISLRKKTKYEAVDLALICTYEGLRTVNNRNEAIISIAGKANAKAGKGDAFKGAVSGKIGFDVQAGFISFAELRVKYDHEAPSPVTNLLDIHLTRVAGNPQNIQPETEPKDPKDPKEVVKNDPKTKTEPKVVLQQVTALTVGDGPDPLQTQPKLNPKSKTPPNFHRVKYFPIQMQAGKKYTISLQTQSFNSALRLETAFGQPAAQAGNAVGNSSQLVFTATQAGVFRIACASRDGKIGQFQLTVMEQ